MNQRTTGFGVGDRFKVRPDESPPPGSYEPPTQFKRSQKARAFSFGLTRNAYQKVYLKNKPVPDTAGKPSPAAYNIREVPGRDKVHFTMRPMTPNPIYLELTRFNPGPGTYSHNSAAHSSFYTSRSKEKLDRLPKDKKRFPIVYGGKLPGPGHYSPRNQFSNRGVYVVSTNKTKLGSSFGRQKRGASTAGRNTETPGPGSYKLHSEFGFDASSMDSTGVFSHTRSNRTEYGTLNSKKKRRLSHMNKSFNFGDNPRLRKNLLDRRDESLVSGGNATSGAQAKDDRASAMSKASEGEGI